jgi:hypothetical protein
MNETESCTVPTAKTPGEKYESIAFTFCKAATIILLTQQFALPIASGAAALFYGMAFVNGKTDTRCILSYPPLIGGFWTLVCIVSTYLTFHPLRF